MGQVGSGKSTLLSAILGEAERLEGSVTVDVGGCSYFLAYYFLVNNLKDLKNFSLI